ncbi:hypothetical protein N657DRAFT_639496 [Parathielavia appendiculata]|uniref:Uncharacterized protein n=1 Tax=Parathielavia appendiculata TaxID=2587402 RepID=A0AAN6UAL0_9PEZI|nr:hypothetical protein N657DRAFT_639496 [Parathielavia appendiculata]
MGLLDDAASVISARTSHSKRSKSHHSRRHSTHHKDRSRSRSRDRSRHRHSRSAAGIGGGISGIAASIFGGGDDEEHLNYHHDGDHHRSSKRRSSYRDKDDDGTRSFFGLPNPSRSSFFSGFGGRHSPSGASYYKRSPRPGFVARMLKRLKRLLRDLLYYAKRHPVKVFMLVLMPLITGGALTALLARFGLRLPKYLERMLGLAAKAGTGDSIGLVGEAVKMVSGGGGGAAARVARASVERGRDAGVQWERRSFERDYVGGGLGGGWSDGLKGITKMFS